MGRLERKIDPDALRRALRGDGFKDTPMGFARKGGKGNPRPHTEYRSYKRNTNRQYHWESPWDTRPNYLGHPPVRENRSRKWDGLSKMPRNRVPLPASPPE